MEDKGICGLASQDSALRRASYAKIRLNFLLHFWNQLMDEPVKHMSESTFFVLLGHFLLSKNLSCLN